MRQHGVAVLTKRRGASKRIGFRPIVPKWREDSVASAREHVRLEDAHRVQAGSVKRSTGARRYKSSRWRNNGRGRTRRETCTRQGLSIFTSGRQKENAICVSILAFGYQIRTIRGQLGYRRCCTTVSHASQTMQNLSSAINILHAMSCAMIK